MPNIDEGVLKAFDPSKDNQTQTDGTYISFLAALLKNINNIGLEYTFLTPGLSGIEGDKRWGYRIKGINIAASTTKKNC